MKVVECINDKNMFHGAEVREGESYEVEKEFINNWGERTYIIRGLKNEGVTPKGLRWRGYKAERFSTVINDKVEIGEMNYMLN